ncbi:MAG TPA: LamG-like jellyroll fold domain-containing protein, partial [Candidatus Acidoferrales bacterium]|nr:LamG-like jellyroll fold domain-containing protein [Candidatus Acidoferrales bacterium]
GGAYLLPNGQAIFFGGSGHVAIYTPTGTTNAGTWTAAADIPSGRRMSEAPSAMMVNGKILCATAPGDTIGGDTQFFEYDYLANTWTPLPPPFGDGPNLATAAFHVGMLPLPDGTVLLSLGSSQLFIYQPDSSPLAAGKPVIKNAVPNADGSLHVTGTLFNGISEGANFGAENQNFSDYPVARITNAAGRVLYCRTYNFSSRSVMTGTNVLGVDLTLPGGLLAGTYPLVISANGNSSAAYSLTITGTPLPSVTGLAFTSIVSNQMTFSWNALGLTQTGYVIQRSTNGTTFSPVAAVGSNVTSYVDNAVSPLTTCYYRVLGTNAIGLGNVGATILAATPPVTALPAPWQAQDIGGGGPGASGQAAGVYTVIGSGGIGGTNDQFQFAFQPLAGDFTLSARVTAGTNAGALSGVMVRNSRNNTSAGALMAFGGGTTNSLFLSRAADGSLALNTAGPGGLNLPLWVRLVRNGNTLTGFTSPDGVSWTQRGTVSAGLELVVFAGLAVSSGNTNLLNASIFDNVTVTGTPALLPPPLAHWKLDETAGATAVDSRGAFNGTYHNCVLGLPGATPETGASVRLSGGSISLPRLGLATNLVTITAWINPDGNQAQYAGIFYGGSASGLVIGTGNQLGYWWNGLPSDYNSGLVLPTNVWSFVALVIEPARARLYLVTNGVLSGVTNNAANGVDAFNFGANFGLGPFQTFFNGGLDDASLYANQALTPAQISQLASTPTISITNPPAGAGFLAPATVSLASSLTATNGHTINLVQLRTNGIFVSQSVTPPYTNTLSGLAAGSYVISAQVFYDSGLVVESDPVNLFIQNPTVTPPNVVATALASNLVNVTWSPAANATGYIVSRNGTPIGAVSGTAFDDFGVSPGASDCYTVVATNLISSSAASASSCLIIPASTGALAWDANASSAGPQDGSGIWDNTSVAWWNGSSTTSWASNSVALFGVNTATNCTVTISRDVSANGVVFGPTRGGSYTITGAQSLILSSNSPVTLNANAVITCPLTTAPGGDSSFTKTGLGKLTISNSSPSFYGIVSINAGTVEVLSGPFLEQIGYIIGTNGTLLHNYFSGFNYSLDIVIHGAGVNSSNGLYIAQGTSLNHNHLTLDTAPTAIRSYAYSTNTGAAIWQAYFGNLSVLAAASGSVIASNVVIDASGYSCVINVASGANTVSGDLVINGGIAGDSPLALTGTGSVRLTAASFYTGPTDVQGGTFQVDALLYASAVTVENTATLAGVGTLTLAPTLASGGTLAPGDHGIGTLTIGAPLTLGAGSATLMELSKVGTTLTNDVLAVNGTLAYGGTLTVTNISAGVLAAGDSFKLFNAGAFASSFSGTNLPALGGSLHWDTSGLATTGTITVANGAPSVPQAIISGAMTLNTAISGTNLRFSWPAEQTGCRLLVQTNNLAAGVSQNTNDWGTVPGSSATNQITVPIDRTMRAEFYRLVYP